MNVYWADRDEFPRDTAGSTLTLGTFDGVHRGHRFVIDRLVENARLSHEQSVLVTFDRHPLEVLDKRRAPRILTTLDEKLERLEAAGLDSVGIVPFTYEVSKLTPAEFASEYLIGRFDMRTFVIGHDHGFGRGRSGTESELRELADEWGFKLAVSDEFLYNGKLVKSSNIRERIESGAVHEAAELLGYEYSLSGTVVRGRGVGRSIGLPTINIEREDMRKQLPAHGVYAGWVMIGESRYDAVISLGARPTFDIDEVALEAHMLEYHEDDLYDQRVRLGFMRWIREIEAFATTESLIQRIHEDIQTFHELKEKLTHGDY